MKKKLCYIAGALNAMSVDYIQNLHRMCVWADKIQKMGFCVYNPGEDIIRGLIIGNLEYNDYFDNSQGWLKVSDCTFVCPGYENSTGTKREINTAERAEIPVFYDLPSLEKFGEST